MYLEYYVLEYVCMYTLVGHAFGARSNCRSLCKGILQVLAQQHSTGIVLGVRSTTVCTVFYILYLYMYIGKDKPGGGGSRRLEFGSISNFKRSMYRTVV